ncbi:MAG: redox-regulated ATPase YchF [Candidatus Diapherotrites archaeon CG08_land_8_20_14_0_20_34_12]|nr:MAG: redox-regulated ATPase YchF [Candidatus Diapherotrites archaeon CG08_land_8_20_14_0_20_34_12]
MQIGIVGKPNSGKSTFFSASTLIDVEIGNRPFVTIKPNQGIGYVTSKCVHPDLGKECQPQNSKCINRVRLIPIQLLDVAGLVKDAWKGRGLGNQFLNDLMQAHALIHVLDISGTTDAEGNPINGGHDPAEDVLFLEKEIDYWIKGILTNNWIKIMRKADAEKKASEALAMQLTGLGISEKHIKGVLVKLGFDDVLEEWSEEQLLEFCEEIRKFSKPMLIACNKIDLPDSRENFERLKKQFPEHIFVACSAEAELALRKAAKEGLIEYIPGGNDFAIKKELPEKQKKALEFIKESILKQYGSTGVQEAINKTAFELLKLIVVYPVQDQNKWISAKGHVLPDAFLIKECSTPKELAAKIHTDFIEKYLGAIDCRSKQKISETTELKNNAVVKILLRG